MASTLLEKAMILPPAAMCWAACAKTRNAPPQVCGNDLVEEFYVALADRRKRHDSRVVDDHIDAAELLHGFFEEPLNVSLVGDICFDRNCLSANHLDFGHDFFSLAGVAEVVHYHGEAVLCQSLGDGAADSTRRPCYDRYLFHKVPPFIPPALSVRQRRQQCRSFYLVSRVSLQGSQLHSVDKAAVGAHDLAVDPAPLRTGQE